MTFSLPRARGALFYLAGWLPLVASATIALRNTAADNWGAAALYALTYLAPGIVLGGVFWIFIEEKIAWERLTWWTRILRELAHAVAFTIGMHALYALFLWLVGGHKALRTAFADRMTWELISGIQIYSVQAVVFHSIRISAELRQRKLAAAEAETLRAKAEMAALRGQLNPHFLFNSLHSITALVREDPPRAEEALLQFAGLLRRVLAVNRDADDALPLAEEMAFVDDYLAIERLRFGDRLRIDCALSPEALGCSLPAFSVQPLVENALRHAIAPRRAGGRVTIRGAVHAGRLELTVSDDGPGAEPAAVAQAKGVGLEVIRRRLHARYGDRAAVTIDTAPGQGFRVTLVLPATAGS